MNRQAVVAALAVALTTATLTTCRTGPSNSEASGSVIEREQHHNCGKIWRRHHCTVAVREDSGKRDTGRVSHEVHKHCEIGEHRPNCKK
ncbi:hypothetical protein JNW90_25740 [Micromonospora sp. STR1s_5]|nr:hypothetical protein [Micromonospora sp. STR1s_5]